MAQGNWACSQTSCLPNSNTPLYILFSQLQQTKLHIFNHSVQGISFRLKGKIQKLLVNDLHVAFLTLSLSRGRLQNEQCEKLDSGDQSSISLGSQSERHTKTFNLQDQATAAAAAAVGLNAPLASRWRWQGTNLYSIIRDICDLQIASHQSTDHWHFMVSRRHDWAIPCSKTSYFLVYCQWDSDKCY